MEETIEGTVERITYSHEETHYTVARIADARGERITVVGILPGLSVGEAIRARGRWVKHKEYGRQFQVEGWERLAPATLQGIERFLGSGLIKGIGPATAKKLVRAFGLDTLRIIEEEAWRLQEIEGIGKVKAERIVEGYRQQREIQEIMVYLHSHDISPALAAKIYQVYGKETIARLEKNPYQMAEDVHGIGFKTADRLAKRLGYPPDSPARARVALKHLLRQAAEEGHVYLPKRVLLARATELLEVEPKSLEAALIRLRESREVNVTEWKGEEPVYLSPFYHAERGVADRLLHLLHTGRTSVRISEGAKLFGEGDLLAVKEEVFSRKEATPFADGNAADEGITLAPAQRQAVEAAEREPLLVVTGGPGTGKTTTVRAIIAACEKRGERVVLAAPTGRAAKRMTESTGAPAKTLHRLLEFSKGEGGGWRFQRDEDHPLEGDVFIIDEASMLDLPLMHHLLKALPKGGRLILVGDVDQLPSVGAGQVLADLIQSSVVPVVRLTTIFRQAEASLIVQNAHRIQRGEPLLIRRDGDFFFVEAEDPETAVERLLDLNQNRLPAYIDGDPIEDVQVLVPMRRGLLGVDALNERLQERLNPPHSGKPSLQTGGRTLRIGDKVMQVRNNYQKEIFNGDVGRITRIDEEEGEVTVTFPDVPASREVVYSTAELDELALAYAVTVHKSQGSEYPVVLLPLTMQHYVMLQRNLFYTAVTRARKLVVVIGQRRAVARAIENADTARRYSLLAERLKGEYRG
jgi:exodeoxyribonuclease V alpha subunit